MQEGGDMGIYVYIWLSHFVVQQKLTQYCEAIILQQRSILKIIIKINLFQEGKKRAYIDFYTQSWCIHFERKMSLFY